MSATSSRPDWRAAEATLGHPRAFERAVAQLPPRQGLILRAIAALDDGRPDQVERVLDLARTSHPDLAAVLDLLLMPVDGIDPSRVRREARQAGVPNPARLPMLDLLRSLAVARTDQTAAPSPALRAAKKGHPALAAVVVALTSRADRVHYEKPLRRWSPRAEQVVVAGRACRVGWQVNDPWLQETFDQVALHLPQERWPSLYEDEEAAQLRQRTKGSAPWSSGHDALSSWLLRRPATEQGHWLAAILARLARDIPAGRLHGLAGAAHVAAHLAEKQPHMRDLAKQLVALDVRLSAVDGPAGPPPWVLSLLWQEREATLPATARLDLARRLVAAGDEDPFDDLYFDKMPRIAACIAATTDDLEEVKDLVLTWLDEVSPDVLRRDLVAEGADPARQELVVGLAAAEDGRIEEALRSARLLATSLGQADDAARIAHSLAAQLAMRGRPRARTLRSIHALLDAIPADPLSADLLDGVLRLAIQAGHVPRALKAESERRLETVGSSPSERARAVAMAMAIGRQDLADRVVVSIGRALRRQAPEDANVQCLSVVCRALGTAILNDQDKLLAVLRPLRAWLLRDGPAPALAAARRLPDTMAMQTGMVIWYLQHHPVLGHDPWWIDRIARIFTGYIGYIGPVSLAGLDRYMLAHLIVAALDTGPMKLHELVDRIRRNIDALGLSSLADMIDDAPPL